MTYTDIPFADDFLAGQYQADQYWGQAGDVLKASCLTTASRQISLFASDLPTDAPDWLKEATCHQALYLLRLAHDTTFPRQHLTLGLSRDEDGNTFDYGYAPQILCPATIRLLRTNGATIDPDALGHKATTVTQAIRP